MVRPLRIEFPGAWYHVMNRGLARRNIFRSDVDRRLFLGLIGDASDIYRIQVHAYSLMDNHYHLLVHTPEPGLSRAMRHLNGLYTQKANRRWESDGPIFRGRYKALLVDSDEYLLELVRYIHLNPVEAGLCAEPADHPWTSHRVYAGKTRPPAWLRTDEVLGRFGRGERRARQELDRYVKAGVSRHFREAVKKSPVILGTKGFAEWVYRNFVDGEKEGVSLQDSRPKPKLGVMGVLDHVSMAYDTPVGELRKGESGIKNEGREMAVYLLRQLCGLSQKTLAKWLGFRNANAAAQMQYRFRKRLEADRQLAKRLHVIQRSILNNVKS